jgi:hypothetical protein
MINIDIIYDNLHKTPSDINEHFPVLKEYTEKCEHVTEMGVRFVNSTFAFLKGNPKIFRCIDLYHPSKWKYEDRLEIVEEYCKQNNIDFKFITGNSLEIEIEDTDLLFIDTLHRYHQLINELNRHSKKVKKFIIMHDTTTYQNNDEQNYYTNFNPESSKRGLWPAIEEFLSGNKEWKLLERKTNNNGLTILERCDENL